MVSEEILGVPEFAHAVEKAKNISKPARIVIAGADSENILKGAISAQEFGFAEPVLLGNRSRIVETLEKIGQSDKSSLIHAVPDGVNQVQYAIEMIKAGHGDVLMRGNTQTRDFLLPVLNKSNHLLMKNLMTHVDLVKIPGLDKVIAVSDVTILVEPSLEQRKDVIRNMVRALRIIGIESPAIALLSLVETPSFHMKDSVEASTLVMEHNEEPFAPCSLVGPIPYDLIVSKEAARLKGYDCPYCGEFDGIVVPNLMVGNIMVKVLTTNAGAAHLSLIMGANIPIAITSRSDDENSAFLSIAAATVMAQRTQEN